MTNTSKLAAYIKSLIPKPTIGITTGTVKSLSPLEISITDEITAKPPHLIIASGLSLDIGDKVIVSSTDNNKFYALGKAVVIT